MSLNAITVDVVRDARTENDAGGDDLVPSTVYSGLSVTIGYKDLSSRFRYETGGGSSSGPGVETKSDRVVFLDPWNGTIEILIDDRVVPNPTVDSLPASLKVVGVRPYEDGAFGQLQLDVEDFG